MKGKQYEIRYVSRRTGLNPHRIRAWERRYGAVRPFRTGTNRRLYDESDIERLKLLREAVETGHRISGLGSLSTAALQRLVRQDRRSEAGATAPGAAAAAGPGAAPSLDELRGDAYRAVRALDAPALEAALDAAVSAHPLRRFLLDFVGPLFADIGRDWSAGSLPIACEHMASAAVRARLGALLKNAAGPGNGDRLLVATPAGHRHEIGALTAALAAAEAGWSPLYLGADLPAGEIVGAVREVSGRAVALSIGHDSETDRLCRELRSLHAGLGGRAAVLAGGPGIRALRRELADLDIRWCGDWNDLLRELGRIDSVGTRR